MGRVETHPRWWDQALGKTSKPLVTPWLHQERYQSCQIKEKIENRSRVAPCTELPSLKNSKITIQHLKSKNLHILHLGSLFLLQIRVLFQFSSQTTDCIMKLDILMYYILLQGGGALEKQQIYHEPAAPLSLPSAADCDANSRQEGSSAAGCRCQLTVLTSLLKGKAGQGY